MNNEVVAINQNTPMVWTPEQIDLVKRTVCPDATDDELKLFMHVCKRTGLDPFARQIYAVKRLNKKTGKHQMVIQTSIDGYRLSASRSNAYAGSDDAVFDKEPKPTKATVTIYKIVQGVRCPFTATARWSEYYPGTEQGFMWDKMPCVMLAKVAEALALRKAFPADLSGVYTKEEMDQADAEQGNEQGSGPGRISASAMQPTSEDGAKGIVVKPTISSGQFAKKRLTELRLPELEKLRDSLLEVKSPTTEQLQDLHRAEELIEIRYASQERPEDDFGHLTESLDTKADPTLCTCGSSLKYSSKGSYYCPNFKDGREHIRPIPKATYESMLESDVK